MCHASLLIMCPPVVFSLQDSARLFHFSLLFISLPVIFFPYDFTRYIMGENGHRAFQTTQTDIRFVCSLALLLTDAENLLTLARLKVCLSFFAFDQQGGAGLCDEDGAQRP